MNNRKEHIKYIQISGNIGTPLCKRIDINSVRAELRATLDYYSSIMNEYNSDSKLQDGNIMLFYIPTSNNSLIIEDVLYIKDNIGWISISALKLNDDEIKDIKSGTPVLSLSVLIHAKYSRIIENENHMKSYMDLGDDTMMFYTDLSENEVDFLKYVNIENNAVNVSNKQVYTSGRYKKISIKENSTMSEEHSQEYESEEELPLVEENTDMKDYIRTETEEDEEEEEVYYEEEEEHDFEQTPRGGKDIYGKVSRLLRLPFVGDVGHCTLV